MSHIYQDKKLKKKKQEKKNWHELSIKMCEKSNRSYNVAVLCRSSKLFCRRVNNDGRTLAAKATEGLCYLILHDTCNAEEIWIV